MSQIGVKIFQMSNWNKKNLGVKWVKKYLKSQMGLKIFLCQMGVKIFQVSNECKKMLRVKWM